MTEEDIKTPTKMNYGRNEFNLVDTVNTLIRTCKQQ